MTSSVTFYNAWFCPFAQRAWIGLLHKDVDFKYVEQDPYDKTADWLAINPRGLVPVIIHNEKAIYESAVCLEYIDEVWKESPKTILSTDPYDRAFDRIWGDFVSNKLSAPFFAILNKKTKDEQDVGKKELLSRLKEFIEAASNDGSFFRGQNLSYVDIMVAPWFFRFFLLKHFRKFDPVKELKDEMLETRIHTWMDALLSEESVKQTNPDESRMLERYSTRY